MKRKEFIQLGLTSAAITSFPGFITACSSSAQESKELFFDISLAEWSLHRTLFDGNLGHLDFPEVTKNKFGIHAVEYVNQFFKDKAKDKSYLDEMNKRCDDLGVEQVLIMIDGEGPLATSDEKERNEAVENHYKWVEAAKHLGCHSIRVNARGNGIPGEQKQAAVAGLGKLATFAKDFDIGVIVENHGGLSSNGAWLASVMEGVGMDNCGTLPDIGNFCIERGENGCAKKYDRYKGVKEMMPYAKGVSAKAKVFNGRGDEKTIDYEKILRIVKEAGFTGFIGIEYSGELNEFEGIQATKKLLEKTGHKIASSAN